MADELPTKVREAIEKGPRMTDLEMTRLCAEAMGDDAWTDINGRWYCHVRGQETIFAPLIDDAQAMALVKKFGMHTNNDGETWWAVDGSGEYDSSDYTDLNRAICECCAKMMLTKKESAHDAQAKGKDR